MKERAKYSTALLQNLGAVVLWSLAPSMIHGITGSFPVNFQNACRYVVALLALWIVLLAGADKERLREYRRALRENAPRILVLGLVQYGFQVCYTYSLFLMTPSVMILVYQTQVLFGVLLGAILFPDERAYIRTPGFCVGLCMALAGVVLVIVCGAGFNASGFGIGILVVLGAAFGWALLGALLKKLVPRVNPLLTISSVYAVAAPLFILTYLITHPGFPVPAAPAGHWLLLVSSALLAIALGQSLFYKAVPVIGVSASTSISLLMPLLAAGVSYLAFGETLTPAQLCGAAVLLGGSFIIMRARFRGGPPAQAHDMGSAPTARSP
jgi:drug/metabolite transporter (DMT)-like permease